MPVKQIVTFHRAFDRLADRYGLEVAATLMPAETAGGVTSRQYDLVVAAIREHGLKAIFVEPQFSPDAAERISHDTGTKVLVLDPLGDPHIPERAGYLPMMRYNLKTLAEGLASNAYDATGQSWMHASLALLHAQNGDVAKGLEHARTARRIEDASRLAVLEIQLLEQVGDRDQARQVVEAARREFPADNGIKTKAAEYGVQ